jgi:hypothetical protein
MNYVGAFKDTSCSGQDTQDKKLELIKELESETCNQNTVENEHKR